MSTGLISSSCWIAPIDMEDSLNIFHQGNLNAIKRMRLFESNVGD